MSINALVASALETHLPKEQLAASTYLAFSLRADELGMFGCAVFFEHESKAERRHLTRLLQFLNDFDVAPEVPAAPVLNAWDRPMDYLFAEALRLEEEVSASLSAIWKLATDQADGLSGAFLIPFLEEQRASEAEYRNILRRLAGCLDMGVFDKWVESQAGVD